MANDATKQPRVIDAITAVDAPRLTQPPVQEALAPARPGSLISQVKHLSAILAEQAHLIDAAETRVFGTTIDGDDFTPPDDASLGIRLRYLNDHLIANCARLEGLLRSL